MSAASNYPVSRDFHVEVNALAIVVRGLKRPECVLALADGRLIASHGDGGYSVVEKNGRVAHTMIDTGGGRSYLPNGIALAPDGAVWFADLGAQAGGIFSIGEGGTLGTVLDAVDGVPLPPSNFLMVDDCNVLWFTVSTRKIPRSDAWNHHVADGFIGVVDQNGARIVADNLGYTNEVAVSPDSEWLYVNETYAQRISRFRLAGAAGRPTLGARETVAQLGGADLPDGLAFDAYGGLWVTCIASNRVLLVRPDGEIQVVISNVDPEHSNFVAHGVQAGSLQPADMQTAGGSRLGNVSSIAFGGARRQTAYLGCLLDDCVRSFESPVAGLELPHARRRFA